VRGRNPNGRCMRGRGSPLSVPLQAGREGQRPAHLALGTMRQYLFRRSDCDVVASESGRESLPGALMATGLGRSQQCETRPVTLRAPAQDELRQSTAQVTDCFIRDRAGISPQWPRCSCRRDSAARSVVLTARDPSREPCSVPATGISSVTANFPPWRGLQGSRRLPIGPAPSAAGTRCARGE
jgi:hypothetical protein